MNGEYHRCVPACWRDRALNMDDGAYSIANNSTLSGLAAGHFPSPPPDAIGGYSYSSPAGLAEPGISSSPEWGRPGGGGRREAMTKKNYNPMNLPNPYFTDIKKVKAILLGADPSNKSDKGKEVQLEYVFGINGKDKRYFAGIERNLAAIGLTRYDIYAQNLIREYQPEETGKNIHWREVAANWLETLRNELDAFDPQRKIPVLVTAQAIIDVLSLEPLPPARDIYLSKADGIVKADENWLGRTLIPFYRHYSYALGKEEYKVYRERVTILVR